MRNPFITECSASPAADNSFVENLGFFQQRKHPYSENFINKNGRRFYESAGASAKHFFCKDKISSILARHEVEKIPVKIAAGWTIKHHYLGSFPSATNCCRLFRRGDSYGHRRFTYGSIQKLGFRIFSVWLTPKTVCFCSVSHLKTHWSLMPEVYFLARVCTLLKLVAALRFRF